MEFKNYKTKEYVRRATNKYYLAHKEEISRRNHIKSFYKKLDNILEQLDEVDEYRKQIILLKLSTYKVWQVEPQIRKQYKDKIEKYINESVDIDNNLFEQLRLYNDDNVYIGNYNLKK